MLSFLVLVCFVLFFLFVRVTAEQEVGLICLIVSQIREVLF